MLYPYAVEGVTLAGLIRTAVLSGSVIPETSLQHLDAECKRQSLLSAMHSHSGREDLESELQALIVSALRQDTLQLGYDGRTWGILLVHHSPMGGARSEREGAELKRNGALAGWPDLQILYRAKGNSFVDTAYLELKTGEGRLSKSQKDLHTRLAQAGQKIRTGKGLVEAVGILVGWLLGGGG